MTERVDFLEPSSDLRIARPCAVAIGYFDGVHRGHKQLVHHLLAAASVRGLDSLVFSFDRIPAKERFDGPERSYSGMIMMPQQRITMLEALGVDHVWLQAFTDRFRALDPQQFFDALVKRVDARVIVVGRDFHYGHERAGNVDTLAAACAAQGIELIVCEDVQLDGERVSSRRVRQALIEGDMQLVRDLLGHPYAIAGPVIHGQALGRTFGLPTANVNLPDGQLCPRYGVYHSLAWIDGRAYHSVTNIGTRPTVNKSNHVPLMETCLLDVDIDLYDRVIEVEFLDWLRAEEVFPSFLTMTARIHEDINEARQWHVSNEQAQLLLDSGNLSHVHIPTRRFSAAILELDLSIAVGQIPYESLAMLARILATTCRRYPTRTAFALAASDLFGASLGVELTRRGDLIGLTIHGDGVRRGTDGSRPFLELVDLVFDMLCDPVLDAEGLLDESLFRAEQRNLAAEWRARRQDRGSYAYERCLRHIFADSPRLEGLPPSAERLAALTREQLSEDWRRLVAEAEVRCYSAGDLRADTIQRIQTRLLALRGHARARYLRPSPRGAGRRRPWPRARAGPGGQTRLVMVYRAPSPISACAAWPCRYSTIYWAAPPIRRSSRPFARNMPGAMNSSRACRRTTRSCWSARPCRLSIRRRRSP